MDLKTTLIKRLDDVRAGFESALPRINPNILIYPEWKLKQILDHITGWDDAVAASLLAHIEGRTPSTPADMGIEAYNTQAISERKDLDLVRSYQDFQASRKRLKQLILAMSDEKVTEPLLAPWGHSATVSEIVAIFSEHEEVHTSDLKRWQENPDKPIKENK